MLNHLWWVGALVVSVQTGLLYSDYCDDMYSNGDNGPFGYGAHSDRSDMISWLLLLGLAGALALSVVFKEQQLRALRAANLILGTAGGCVAFLDRVVQTERNPYCRTSGVWSVVVFAGPIFAAAVIANSGLLGLVARLRQRPAV
ncbi:MAG: hypothetical protein ABMA25_04625 [Ilumatobacteraceae bacterium]